MLSYFRNDACSVCLDAISLLSLSFARKYYEITHTHTHKTLFPDFCYHIQKVYEYLIHSFLTYWLYESAMNSVETFFNFIPD